MQLKNTSERYGDIAKTLHWLMAIAIITMLAVGLIMTDMQMGPDKFELYGLHKSTGVVILLFVCMRLLWRVINPTPALPEHMKRIERFMAHSSHAVLYTIMIAMPLSGWLMSSAAGFPVSVYGWFVLPDLIEASNERRIVFSDIHEYVGYFMILMIVLHTFAALLHHFYHKDNVLKRMLPW